MKTMAITAVTTVMVVGVLWVSEASSSLSHGMIEVSIVSFEVTAIAVVKVLIATTIICHYCY